MCVQKYKVRRKDKLKAREGRNKKKKEIENKVMMDRKMDSLRNGDKKALKKWKEGRGGRRRKEGRKVRNLEVSSEGIKN